MDLKLSLFIASAGEKITTEKDKKREILMTLELDIIIRIPPIKSFEWCIFEEFPY